MKEGGAHHVHWSQSLSRAVGIHGLCDVPADMHLHHLLNRVGKVGIGQEIPSRVIDCLAPLVAAFTV